MKSTNRARKKFSRIGEDNGMAISQIINAPYEQTQKRNESCFMPECAGKAIYDEVSKKYLNRRY
jgi:hypothetical protein